MSKYVYCALLFSVLPLWSSPPNNGGQVAEQSSQKISHLEPFDLPDILPHFDVGGSASIADSGVQKGEVPEWFLDNKPLNLDDDVVQAGSEIVIPKIEKNQPLKQKKKSKKPMTRSINVLSRDVRDLLGDADNLLFEDRDVELLRHFSAGLSDASIPELKDGGDDLIDMLSYQGLGFDPYGNKDEHGFGPFVINIDRDTGDLKKES